MTNIYYRLLLREDTCERVKKYAKANLNIKIYNLDFQLDDIVREMLDDEGY